MKSIMTVTLNCDVKTVWDVVTDNINTSWRSDLKETKVLSDKDFQEIDKEGIVTTFHITKQEPYDCYEFDLENDNMKGHWTGRFSILSDQQVEFELTEEVTMKKGWLKVFVTITSYLKRMQKHYISDLKKKIEEK